MQKKSPTYYVAGDANTGAGYGKLDQKFSGKSQLKTQTWPYDVLTDLENEAQQQVYVDDETVQATSKKLKSKSRVDHLAAKNYKAHAFVNGSTRGLTGIMSGVDSVDILESTIKKLLEKHNNTRDEEAGGVFGFKNVGLGAPQVTTMHPSSSARTAPKRGFGSKRGWFSPHPPKDDDPINADNRYSLKDIVKGKNNRAINNAKIEHIRNTNKLDVDACDLSMCYTDE